MTSLVISILVSCDQVAKFFALKYLFGLAFGPLHLISYLNTALIFSFKADNKIGVVFSTFFLFTLLLAQIYGRLTPTNQLALSFMIGGGLSNLLDRLFRGGVLDIFAIQTMQFNLADAFIAVGLTLILFKLSYPHISNTNPK